MMIVSSLMIMVAACSKDNDNDGDNNNNNDNTNPTEVEPLINAGVINSGNPVESTGIHIPITDVNHQGAAVTNAIVKVNNIVIPHITSGMYQLIITDNPILPGSTVNLEVQCAGETFYASAVMPESGGIEVPVSGAAAGSKLVVGHN